MGFQDSAVHFLSLSSRSHFYPGLEGLCVLGTGRQAPEPPTLLSVARAHHHAPAPGEMQLLGV